jgi:leader peptidase (prepilin peptidase) / N-methyltransferase
MIYIVIGGLGLAVGSFINALVWRIHEQSKAKSQTPKAQQKSAHQNEYSILAGRSMCPHCKHTLAPSDLIPLLSWLALSGRCRYCKKPISRQYPLVELIAAFLFVVSFAAWPHGFGSEGTLLFGSWLLLLTGLIALAVYDIKWMLLPNRIVYPLITFWATVAILRATAFGGGTGMIISVFLGVLVCGGLFWLIFQLSVGKWIGGGDVKLGFLLGMVAGGAMPGIMIVFLASLLGTVWTLPLLLNKKIGMKAQVPFGPFLIAATIIVYLFGKQLQESLLGYFLVV